MIPAKYNDPAYITKLARTAKRVPDNWALCEFTGDSESEIMVAQTLQVADNNAKKFGVPASVRHPNVFGRSGAGLVDNAKGYAKLLERGYIEEVEVDSRSLPFPAPKGTEAEGKVVLLFATEVLLNAVKRHTDRK